MKNHIGHFFELLLEMTNKELKARYKNTIFGFLWIFINPLLQMIVIGFVFKFFIKQPIENYYYYLLVGLIMWNFFSISLTKGTSSIVWERNLIKKAYFPRAIIPLSIICSNFINLIISISIVSILLIVNGKFTISGLPFVLLAFILLLLFTTGITLLTSALNVRFRDVNFFMQALLIIWFYMNPIVYTLNMIPYKYYWFWRLNPMTSIFQFIQRGFLNMDLPGVAMISINIVLIFTTLILGIIIFNKESKNFDDWL